MGIPNSMYTLYGLFIFLALVCVTKQQYEGIVLEVSHHFQEKLSNQLEQQILSYHNLELAYKAYAAYFDRADVDLPGFKKFFRQLEGHALKNAVTMTTYINTRGGRIRFPVVKLGDACDYIKEFNKLNPDTASAKLHICHFQSKVKAVDSSNLKSKEKSYSWPGWLSKKNNDNSEASAEYNNKLWRSKSGLHGLEDALTWEKYVNNELQDLITLAKRHHDPHTKLTIETFMEHQVDTIKEVADLITRLKQYLQDDEYPLGEYLLDKELDK